MRKKRIKKVSRRALVSEIKYLREQDVASARRTEDLKRMYEKQIRALEELPRNREECNRAMDALAQCATSLSHALNNLYGPMSYKG